MGQPIEVVTLAESIYLLSGYVQDAQLGKGSESALLARLKAAAAAMERGNFNASLNQLRAFQNQVRAQFASSDPEFAAELILSSGVIRDVLSAGQAP